MTLQKFKSMFFSTIKWLLALLTLGYIGFALLLYSNQRNMIYYPTPEVSLPNQQAIYVTHGNVRIKTWKIHSNHKKAVIFFGGNADAVEYYIPIFDKTLPNYTIYLVNYRGYGGSNGKPTEQALFDDAVAVYDYAKQRSTQISVIGRSLGTGVTSFLAAQRDVRNLVLITPFDSILSVAQDVFPIYPMSILLKDKFYSIHYAPNIKANVLMMVAGKDRTVPPVHAELLMAAFKPKQVTVKRWKNAGHVNISHQQGFYEEITDFIEK